MTDPSRRKHAVQLAGAVLLPVLVAGVLAPVLLFAAPPVAARTPPPPEVVRWGLAAAAAVTALCAIGSAYAVAVVGGAAMGAVAEKPETAGRALVFVGLAEGIAIYGLIVAIMILERIT
jgi:V/A-type H+-transporting ATPase subunit K